MATWYLAVCQDCVPVLPQPFADPAERDRWQSAHEQATGHAVVAATETRLLCGYRH